ncbi:MAG: hypothetical protein HC904_16510 [Blastochloris sp.]|nr:hypothetical protein [Blastochloris sp.]
MSRKQVEAVFTGDVMNWSEVGGPNAPIVVYNRDTSSGSFHDFQRIAMNGRNYTKSAIRWPNSDPITTAISRDPFGITFLGFAYANDPAIKTVKVDTLLPSDNSYPYRWPSFYFTRADSKQSVNDFIEWATHSQEAQVLMAREGFIPAQK